MFIKINKKQVTLTFKISPTGVIRATFSDDRKDAVLPGAEYWFPVQCYWGQIPENSVNTYISYIKDLYGTVSAYKYDSKGTFIISFELSMDIPVDDKFEQTAEVTFTVEERKARATFSDGRTVADLPHIHYSDYLEEFFGWFPRDKYTQEDYIKELKYSLGKPTNYSCDNEGIVTISFNVPALPVPGVIVVSIVDANCITTNLTQLSYCEYDIEHECFKLLPRFDLSYFVQRLINQYGKPVSDNYYPISRAYANKRVLEFKCT